MVQAWMKASYINTAHGLTLHGCEYAVNDDWVIVKTKHGTYKIPINSIHLIMVEEWIWMI